MPSHVSMLDEVGDADAPVGSRAWAVYFLGRAKSARKDLDSDARRLRDLLTKLENGRAWKPLRLKSFDHVCAELALTRDQVEAIRAARPGATLAAVLDAAPELATHEEAGAKGGRGNKASSETTAFGRDNSYLAARIKRDHPDIAERVRAGEFKSMRAAALEAGIIKRRVTVPLEPDAAARSLRKHFTPDQIAELVRLLHD